MKKRITKISSIFLVFMMVMTLFKDSYFVHAEDKITVNVRVEGINSTICEGNVEVNSGSVAYDALAALLTEKNIENIIIDGKYGKEIVEIDNIKKGKFGGYDGWMYTVKKASGFDTDNVLNNGISSYAIHNGDNIIIYYGDYSMTPCANTIKFTPEIPKGGQLSSIKLSYKRTDWIQDNSGNWVPIVNETPIVGVLFTIDNDNYITDSNGNITISEGLSIGEHRYSITGYMGNSVPNVVADKGTFTIDGVNNPSLDYSDVAFDTLYKQDNTKIIKNIPEELKTTGAYFTKYGGDEWATVSAAKMGIKIDSSFLKDYAKDITENGAAYYSNTDLEKLIISLTASGYSPYNFMGKDLIAELFNRDINKFAINDAIFALISYKYCNINDKDYKLKKIDLITSILNKQYTYDKGTKLYGWALSKADSDVAPDPDITGIAINALSQYYETDANVKTSVDKAISSLSIMQNGSGYLIGKNGLTSESLSFAILGLISVGKNPQGAEFSKINGDLISALLSFKGTDGQFKHTSSGSNDALATEEAYRALIAINSFTRDGKYDYYSSNIDASKLAIFNLNLVQEINNAADGSTTVVDAANNSVINKEVFNAIKGQNKNVAFNYNGISWTFNGMNITSEVDSNIDLSLKDVTDALKGKEVSKIKALIGKDIPLFSFSFNYDGKLPGKATAKIFVGSAWANKDVTIFRYYSDKNSYEKITTGHVDKDGYLTYTIDHCSDYFITETSYVEKLPQTGSPLDTKIIVDMGALMLAAGAALVYANKKKDKEEERA